VIDERDDPVDESMYPHGLRIWKTALESSVDDDHDKREEDPVKW
jgi:hypothetical protein